MGLRKRHTAPPQARRRSHDVARIPMDIVLARCCNLAARRGHSHTRQGSSAHGLRQADDHGVPHCRWQRPLANSGQAP
eukprot:11528398-Alexandrium_andersonii.AAC.1